MIVFTALSIAIPRKVFFEYWLDAGHGRDVSALQRHLFAREKVEESRVVNLSALRKDISRSAARIRRRYLRRGHGSHLYETEDAEWLDEGPFEFSVVLEISPEKSRSTPKGFRRSRPQVSQSMENSLSFTRILLSFVYTEAESHGE